MMETIQNLERATDDLVRAYAAIGQIRAQADSICPACEQGYHEHASTCGFHRLFACACKCNTEAK